MLDVIANFFQNYAEFSQQA